MKTFNKIQTNDYQIDTIQSNIETVFSSLLLNPLINSSIIEDVALTTGTNQISHKLGRKIKGYIIVRRSSAATIYDTKSDLPDRLLTLVASAPITVSLIVF